MFLLPVSLKCTLALPSQWRNTAHSLDQAKQQSCTTYPLEPFLFAVNSVLGIYQSVQETIAILTPDTEYLVQSGTITIVNK